MHGHLNGPGGQATWVPVPMAYPPGMMAAPGMIAPGMMFGYGYPSPGPMPGIPADALRAYGSFGGMAAMPQDVDTTASLAERLNELQLGGSRRSPLPPHPGGPYNRGAPAGPGPAQWGVYSTGPMPQHHGRERQGRGGGRGGGPHFAGGRGQGNMQKKKRPQRGLEDNIRRTVYISYVDCQVTEEMLASFFLDCGKVMDCRICGDPNSAMRFAFIEFAEVESAQRALEKTGSVLGNSPLRVLASKTAIMPVNQELMPRSADEVERCSRTVYAANIDKKVDKNDVRAFFESLCGKVSRIRLLGDYAHSTRIAFVEFHHAEGALAALNCSGALLGSLPIRVSPSKTPVKVDSSARDGGSSEQGPTSSAASSQSLSHLQPPPQQQQQQGASSQAQQVQREPEQQQEQAESEEQQ